MIKKNILFLHGIGDSAKIQIEKINRDASVNYVITGSANIHEYIACEKFDIEVITFDTRKNQEIILRKCDAIFNQVSDPDTHTIALEKVENTYRYLNESVPIFNRPEAIRRTRRENIYTLLKGIDKLKVPKTIRISPSSPEDIYDAIKREHFIFPVIFRKAGDHGGVSTMRIDHEEEMFYDYCLNGEDYYLTEFVSYANNEGIYTKYRLVVVDGEVYIRHVILGKEWMVHAGNQLENEKSLAFKTSVSQRFSTEIKPYIQPVITEIYKHLELDYFGIDCDIDKEMNLLIFEINANMNVFLDTQNSVFEPHVEKIKSAVIKMLSEVKI